MSSLVTATSTLSSVGAPRTVLIAQDATDSCQPPGPVASKPFGREDGVVPTAPLPESPGERVELQAVLRRVYQLSYRQQVRLLNTIRLYISDIGGQNELDDQLVEREEGLAAMSAVAVHMQLPDGQAPNSRQYRIAAEELGLDDWKVNRFQKVFGRWRFAEDSYLGRRVRETPGQKALRRATSGRTRTHETYLAGVQQWLEDIKPAATTQDDYDTYRAAVNPQRVRLGEPPLVRANTVRIQLHLPWSAVLQCARGEAKLDEMLASQAATDAEHEAGPLRLIGVTAVARITGTPKGTLRNAIERGEFPVAVATIGGQTAWHLARAYERAPTGRDGRDESRGNGRIEWLITTQLAEWIGRSPGWIWAALHRWPHRLPPAAGRVSAARYWLKTDVEAFYSRAATTERTDSSP